MITKTFSLADGHSVAGIARAMDAFLRREEKMNVTRYRCEDGGYLVCARACDGRALRWAGLDRSVSASVFSRTDGTAVVEIRGGCWRDKGLALGASLFLLWPLAITAGVGAIRQRCLPGQLLSAVQLYLQKKPGEYPNWPD